MGFISYNLSFYRAELARLAACAADEGTVYRARQLLKLLDDLADEGYTELGDALEADCRGVSRLREYLRAHNAAPFPLSLQPPGAADVAYASGDEELTGAIRALCAGAAASHAVCGDAFLERLRAFCEWIGYEEDTAYIFLLRDALLPYIYYLSRGRKRIYPWLLGRKAFGAMTGCANADDGIRASIIDALERGCADFGAFCGHALPDIRATLARYPGAAACLRSMLGGIRERRIVIVESGCSGTFPMLLMSLDERADLRMYTTYPYLTGVYSGRIFTPRYEENRLFETLESQDMYFSFSSLREGRFYVRRCTSAAVEARALAEARAFLP